MGIQPGYHTAGRNAGNADHPPRPDARQPAGDATDNDDTTGAVATARSPGRLLAIAIAGLLIGAFVADVSWMQAGPTFGFYLGPLMLAVVLAPYLALMSAGEPRRSNFAAVGWVCVGPVGYGIGAGAAWLIGGRGHDPALAIVACGIVLVTFTLAVAEGTLLLRIVLRSRLLAGFVAVFAGAGWLTWPIWLSHAVRYRAGQTWVDGLAPLHPLLAMNGALPSAGTWTQQSIAYHLTNLGQDVYYVFPATIWPCVAVQVGAAIALALLVVAWVRVMRRFQR